MNYKVRRKGVDLGSFDLDELRRRHAQGEFSGAEYVQRDGMSDWQPLDFVLQQGYRATPPPVPKLTTSGGPNPILIGGAILLGVLFFIGIVVFFARVGFQAQQQIYSNRSRSSLNQSRPQSVTAASQPVVWTTNSLTVTDVRARAIEFRTRQWLDGYRERGRRDPECDAEVIQFLEAWNVRTNTAGELADKIFLERESDRLAGNPHCTDPLVLTVAAVNSANRIDAVERYERASAAFLNSQHRAYPKLYANIMLTAQLTADADRSGARTTSALRLLSDCFTDRSFTPDDQPEIAEIFLNGWGEHFFQSNTVAVCEVMRQAGSNYLWLANVLDGEREINEAWAARGNGYANTVSDTAGQSFSSHLARAREHLTAAWKLRPDWPQAPDRMITVALGDSGIDEMRVWFDRTTMVQIDYPGAWSEMRWGLRPRWYGNEASMLAFGRTAIDTGRFDTDVPRKYIDCIADVESEMSSAANHHIYGRDDIWPNLQRMYDGYIASPTQNKSRDGWRTSYAVVAFFAQKYDIARTQLEILNWQPVAQNLTRWDVNLPSMPLEVAARTGSLSKEIYNAELLFNSGKTLQALIAYEKLKTATADERTRQFIQLRLASLQTVKQLSAGAWMDFLPKQKNDATWTVTRGQIQLLANGAVEVTSTANGHELYSKALIDTNFEVRGEFEVVHTSGRSDFQAGLIFGDWGYSQNNWDSFRMRRSEQGDQASIGHGWTKTEILRPVKLNNTTNTFDFIFKDGYVTASVNDQEVFHQIQPPTAIVGHSFIVGLGGFTHANAVIRYRNVQIRDLE